eukprot:scaffold1769_cov164-Ochromonas_danica.AAC.9
MVSMVWAFRVTASARSGTALKMSGDVPNSFYDIVEKDANGNNVSFEKFRGKVVYGVNVASKCGFTSSGYQLLARIAELKDKGVEVALFPCNQFLGQEPGSDAEISAFCAAKGVKGANVFTKADVNGANTRPTYRYLKAKGVLGDVRWNFAGKFIVDKQGNVLPIKNEKDIEKDILALAAK